jgi:hypothetical protein
MALAPVGQSGEAFIPMKFPCQGRFWLPGSEEKSVFGTLTFSRREGAVLSLPDSLPSSDSRRVFDVILGQTAGGAYVTLLRAFCTAQPLFPLTPTRPCSYHATFLIVGAAFDSETDMRFSLWQVRVPELKSWAARHGFDENAGEVFADPDQREVRLHYRSPNPKMLLSDGGGPSLSLVFSPLVRISPFERAIRQDVCVEIRLPEGNDALQDFMVTTARFEHFLTLATGTLVRTGAISAMVRTENAVDSPIIVEVLYEPVRNAPARTPRPDEFLFSLRDIEGHEQNCFGNWFAKAEWLDPVCVLYFGTLYNPSRYLDFNFLALVQAVEAYHRRASDQTDLTLPEHETRINAILDAVPAAHREWLAGKLKYSNELSLRRRLKILFSQFSYLLDGLIPDHKATINAIYDNRNYLTHYDVTLKGRAARGSRLAFLVEVLKLLLQASLLRELGFPDARIQEFIGRSRTVRMIRHLSEPTPAT